MKGPLVSILIPCYNAETWIRQAIESALAQTYKSCEIIVVDDGSTDGSLSEIQAFDGRIRWEAGPNRGGNPTRNRLLKLSRGEWLQYLDADDWLKPDKIEKQMEAIEKDPAVDVLYSPTRFAWHEDNGIREKAHPIPEPHDPWMLLASWNLPQTGGPLWRRQALLDVSGWNNRQPCCQEHELYLRLLKAGKRFRHFPGDGAVYRQWSSDTVCKRNIPLVHSKRLEIEDDLETHLRTSGELTPLRANAINQARFEIARGRWHYDRRGAQHLIQKMHASDPNFIPQGPAAPSSYQTLYRFLGFTAAERIAEGFRRFRPKATASV